ncbi:MAG: hypothetical protein ABSC00_09030 [Acidimicrobiales bacterium]
MDPNIYPAPVSPGMGDYRSGCPSLAGVDSSARPSLDQLAQALFDLGGSQTEALQVTDPAFWPMILTNKYGTYYGGGSRPVSQLVSLLVVTPASQSGYVFLVSHCGYPTTASSWIAQICTNPDGRTGARACDSYPALATEVVFIDRLGHWLIVYSYP